MFLAKLIIYLLISFVLPYFFTFFNYFLCLCWLSTMPLQNFQFYPTHLRETGTTKTESRCTELFQRLEQLVPPHGIKCSNGWNKVFHGVES